MPPTKRVTYRSLICIAVGLIGLAVIAIGFVINSLRKDAIADAKAETGNIAAVLAEQTSRSVQAIDLVMTELQERFDGLGLRSVEEFRERADKLDMHYLLARARGAPAASRRDRLDRRQRRMHQFVAQLAGAEIQCLAIATISSHFRDERESRLVHQRAPAQSRQRSQDRLLQPAHQSASDGRLPRHRAGRRQAHLFPAHLQFAHLVAQSLAPVPAQGRHHPGALSGNRKHQRHQDAGEFAVVRRGRGRRRRLQHAREFSTTARASCRRGRCATIRWWSMSRCPAMRRSRIGAAARS